MLSKATYLLPTLRYREKSLCFYLEDKGCLTNTAQYFYKMHHDKDSNGGGFAEVFFKVNPHATLTSCHEAHIETHFRYTLNTKGTLSVWAKEYNQWDILYQGYWHQFVNIYIEPSQHLHLFKLYKTLEHESLMTIQQAQRWIKAFTNTASRCPDVQVGVDSIQAQVDDLLAQQQMSD